MLTFADYPTVRRLVLDYLSQVASPACTSTIAEYVARNWPTPPGPLNNPEHDTACDILAAMLTMTNEDPPLIQFANVTLTFAGRVPLLNTTHWQLTQAGKTAGHRPSH